FFSVSHSKRPQRHSDKVSVSGPEGSRLETRFSRRSAVPNVAPLVRCGTLERVPAKVPSLSSDHGSK
ncbi:hypothetical protein AVEN_257173-1, partial [Araneus ventricosus]